jgi:hypothetical protein
MKCDQCQREAVCQYDPYLHTWFCSQDCFDTYCQAHGPLTADERRIAELEERVAELKAQVAALTGGSTTYKA